MTGTAPESRCTSQGPKGTPWTAASSTAACAGGLTIIQCSGASAATRISTGYTSDSGANGAEPRNNSWRRASRASRASSRRNVSGVFTLFPCTLMSQLQDTFCRTCWSFLICTPAIGRFAERSECGPTIAGFSFLPRCPSRRGVSTLSGREGAWIRIG